MIISSFLKNMRQVIHYRCVCYFCATAAEPGLGLGEAVYFCDFIAHGKAYLYCFRHFRRGAFAPITFSGSYSIPALCLTVFIHSKMVAKRKGG